MLDRTGKPKLAILAPLLLTAFMLGLFTPPFSVAKTITFGVLDESIFPENYPEYLKQVYSLLRKAESLKQLRVERRTNILKDQEKDLRLVLQEADELSVPALGTSTAFHLYRSLQRRGLGAEGNHALVRALEFMSDLQVGQ